MGRVGALTDFLDTQTLTSLAAAADAVILMPVPNATPVKIKAYPATTVLQINVTAGTVSGAGTLYLFGILY